MRCTVVLFVNNFGEKMPPIIILRVQKPKDKKFDDIPEEKTLKLQDEKKKKT